MKFIIFTDCQQFSLFHDFFLYIFTYYDFLFLIYSSTYSSNNILLFYLFHLFCFFYLSYFIYFFYLSYFIYFIHLFSFFIYLIYVIHLFILLKATHSYLFGDWETKRHSWYEEQSTNILCI